MDRLAYSINDTARLLSMGRTSIYAMIADQRLDAFKLGRRTLVPFFMLVLLGVELECAAASANRRQE